MCCVFILSVQECTIKEWLYFLVNSVGDKVFVFFSFSAVHSLLKSAFNTVAIEKEKIKQVLSDQEQSDQISSLRKSLSQVSTSLPIMPLSTRTAQRTSLLSLAVSLNWFSRFMCKHTHDSSYAGRRDNQL